MLIHIIPSYSLNILLNKQKGKKKLIKTRVYNIYRPRLTPDKLDTLESTNLIMKQNYYKEKRYNTYLL